MLIAIICKLYQLFADPNSMWKYNLRCAIWLAQSTECIFVCVCVCYLTDSFNRPNCLIVPFGRTELHANRFIASILQPTILVSLFIFPLSFCYSVWQHAFVAETKNYHKMYAFCSSKLIGIDKSLVE